MQARVFAYDIQPGRMEDRLRYGLELLPVSRAQADCAGLLLLVDRERNDNVAIQVWETAEHLNASVRDSDFVQQLPFQPHLGFADSSVDIRTFEVDTYEMPAGSTPRHARVMRYDVPDGRLDQMLRYLEQTTRPVARQQQGWSGALVLADRAADQIMIVSLWAGAEERDAIEGNPDYLAVLPETRFGATLLDTRHLEVAIAE
jgi:hypothetical protein